MAQRRRSDRHRRAVIGAGLLALCVPACIVAQQVTATLDAGATTVGYADSLHQRAASVAPSIRIDAPWASATASGLYAQNTDGSWTTQGGAAASLYTPLFRGVPWLHGELAASGGGSTHRDGTQTGTMLLQGRLHVAHPSWGASWGAAWGGWLGGGAGRTWDGTAWRRLTLGNAGAWGDIGATQLVATATPTIVDDGSGTRIRYTDVQGSLRWTLPRVTLGASLGTRLGQNFATVPRDVTTWGSASAAVWFLRSVAVVASGGTYPIDFTQGFPGGRYTSVGLRVESHWQHGGAPLRMDDAVFRTVHSPPVTPAVEAVTQFTMRDTVDGSGRQQRVFRAQVVDATRVDISGDFTNWQPRPLTPAGGGWWTVTLPLSSGIHQMTLRVNGASWIVPPGLSPLTDEFGGVVGVIGVP